MKEFEPLVILSQLRRGDVVRHRITGKRFIVTENYGHRVTAVATADITNPIEWEILREVVSNAEVPKQGS